MVAEPESDDTAQAYAPALAIRDAFGIVIRGGAYIDIQLAGLIDDQMVNPKALEDGQFGYRTKCLLALGLGLPSRLKGPLFAMGRIRNRFAHDPGAKLDASDTGYLISSLAAEDVQTMKQIRTSWFAPVEGRDPILDDNNPLDVFVLFSTTLRSTLMHERNVLLYARNVSMGVHPPASASVSDIALALSKGKKG